MLKVGKTTDNFQELNENQQEKDSLVPVKVSFCLGSPSASVLLRHVILFDEVKRHEDGDHTRLCLKAQRVRCAAVFNDLNVLKQGNLTKPSCWPTVKSSGISEIPTIDAFLIQVSVGNIHRTVVWAGHVQVLYPGSDYSQTGDSSKQEKAETPPALILISNNSNGETTLLFTFIFQHLLCVPPEGGFVPSFENGGPMEEEIISRLH